MRLGLFILLSFTSLLSIAQGENSNHIVGKWQVCYNLDNYDTVCAKPFNSFILKEGGIYQGKDFICGNIMIFMKGVWTFDGTKLVITSRGNQCGASYDQVYPNIIFVNKDFFYYKVVDTYENPGHMVFFSFKRIE